MTTPTEKLLASLSYFSVFFAPILFPIIVWIATGPPVSTHAKKALLYHILPWILILIAVICFGLTQSYNHTVAAVLFILGILTALGSVFYLIYNLYCGVKVLVTDE